jgi:hypothetical protein
MLRRNVDDNRRAKELEENFQTKALRKFTSNPDVKQLKQREVALVEATGGNYLVTRIGNSLFKVDLTAV